MRFIMIILAAALASAPALAQQADSGLPQSAAQKPGEKAVSMVTPPDESREPREIGKAQGGSGPVFATRTSAGHGPYLIDGDGRTVYLFAPERPAGPDKAPGFKCTGTCTTIFPPVIVDSRPAAGDGVKSDLLGTVERADGRLQATYGGWPLYRYIGDKGAGHAAAAGFGKPQFGGEWHLVGLNGNPAGERIRPDDRFSGLDFKGPECVRYDPEGAFYLVSNVNGGFTDPDNNGFISRIGRKGPKLLKWIEAGKNGVTLNAPTGMEIAKDRLFVADIDHLRMFDIVTGDPLGAVAVPGAQMLNDLAVGKDEIYVTDSGTGGGKPGAVYRIARDGAVTKIVPGRVIARPDGIDFDSEGRLLVTEFAGNQVFTLTTDGRIVAKTRLEAGQLDGIVARRDGDVLVSSWNGRHIARIAPDGSIEILVTGLTTPACFDVEEDEDETVLLVPEFDVNRVTIAPLPTRG